jgi:hypothetical protein
MTAIYHITHLDNLAGILAEQGLWSDVERARRSLNPRNIAYEHIKQRRLHRPVPVGPGGVVADYVPFYFCSRSPMLYAIHTQQIPNYPGGQAEILHLAALAESVAARPLPFVFSDGHAEMEISNFYTDLARLDQVDWGVVNNWSWRNTAADNDRKRRKQAEFLVQGFFPWDLVAEIGVSDAAQKSQVEAVIAHMFYKPIVNVRPKWYYDR